MSRLFDGNTATLHAVPKAQPDPARDAARTSVKTTVELPADLWRAAKIRAMDDRADLRNVFIRALEAYLGVSSEPVPPTPRRTRGKSA